MAHPLLQVQDLSVRFGQDGAAPKAVDSVNFSVEQGEVVAVVGESGSGKSVTALSLLQLLPGGTSISGRLNFSKNGNEPIDLLKQGAKQIRNIRGKDIAMIFQEPMTSLNPVLTVGYQLIETIQLHQQISAEEAKAKTIALFQQVQLPNPSTIINRYPHELSGGQKQRVMIAMAISCNPALLIADEPTTALDVTVQKNILTLIKNIQQQNGMGVIFITHDLGLVEMIADKVVVMYRGQIVEQGLTDNVLKDPQHNYTKALMACRPVLHARGERLPVVSDFFNGTNVTSVKVESIVNTTTINFSNETVLDVQNLEVSYAGKKSIFKKNEVSFKAVDDVSFKVHKGETVGLVGESGCGKTTLGRAILKLVNADAGRINLNGKDITKLSQKDMQPMRQDLQIVFQDPYGSLNPRLTIGEAILEPMAVHQLYDNKKQRKEKVIDLLEKVNLNASHFNRYPHQFSGGQRQRICIARALSINPSFLIFDESVSALDISVQAQVLNLLNDLKKAFGYTAIFISHDLSVVHYICDRILVMQKGRIIESGTSDAIYFSPQDPYTQKLIAAIPGKH